MLRILQLTDCHLFTDPTAALRGVLTWPRFLATIHDIRQRVPEFELLVITGDTAHDDAATTYEKVRDALGIWANRLRILPGNHDHRPTLRAVFPSCEGIGDAPIQFDHCGDHWRVMGWDTQQPGQIAGALGELQREQLRAMLAHQPDTPTLVFFHHPPVSSHSPWLDRIGLQDARDVEDLLRNAPQVRLIGCGHVHQALTASLAHAVVLTTPAVGPPFRPRTSELEIDTVPPAYRLFELYPDGHWFTQVFQVTQPSPAATINH